MGEGENTVGIRLDAHLVQAGYEPLGAALARRFEDYCSLILRWNNRVNLTAIRDEEGILTRHFVESIACARALPAGISTLLDFGSGAGFPGIPIALCRPEIAVTLAESQGKKAAFLQEAVRQLELAARPVSENSMGLQGNDFSCSVSDVESTRALVPEGHFSGTSHEIPLLFEGCIVHSGRAEALRTVFDCVVLRAVDRMELAVQAAAPLVRPGGWLALMTTRADLPSLQSAAGPEFFWSKELPLPGSAERLFALGELCNRPVFE
jgi:16S rRNA (guanine527-N7)-methyltransferase